MKKFKLKSLLFAPLAVIMAVPMFCVPAFANSGPAWESGVTSTGIHCVNENSVLQVQSETLTFNIGTPLYDLSEDEKYDTTVTAEYTFYNPSENTVTTKMAFPIGLMPYYAKDNKKIEGIENPITVDGQPVAYEVRHTYGIYNSFEEDVKKIKDGYYETDFYTADLPITEYVFKVNLPDSQYATVKATIPQNTGTRYFGYSEDNNSFYYQKYNGDKFSIFVLGNDYDLSDLNWSITRYSESLGRSVEVNGSVTLEKKNEPTTFMDYVLKGYDTQSDVSKVDYYNAMFDLIKTDSIVAGTGLTPMNNYFTEWYVYETSVEAGGTFKNAVTANLYPTTYYNYSPYVYEFSYYLSPAREWASFGDLTVNINTTQYLQKCDYYDPDNAENSVFTKTETGYTATFTSLPTTELTFKTCAVETPEYGGVYFASDEEAVVTIIVALIVAFAILLAPSLITGIVILIVFLVKRKKKKKQQLAQSQLPPEPPTTGGGDNGGDGVQPDGDGDVNKEISGDANVEQSNNNFCIYCGSKLTPNAKFCISCGSNVGTVKAVQVSQPVQVIQPVQENKKRVNGFGIAGFVVSIVSLCLVFSEISILFALTGFGLSLAGVILRKKYQRVYGLAIAGLVISSVAILTLIIIYSLVFLCVFLFCISGGML
ncbi:MAG: hypothetical protein ACI4MN_01770 [Candidatus Coproplasma sp.]